MVSGDLHVQSTTTVSKILSCQHSALLANQERSRVRIAADVVGADGQVGDLEALDAVDVQALIEHTVLDDGVAVPGSHGARSKRVPCSLNVACNVHVSECSSRDTYRGE